jgi:hypothetical protein
VAVVYAVYWLFVVCDIRVIRSGTNLKLPRHGIQSRKTLGDLISSAFKKSIHHQAKCSCAAHVMKVSFLSILLAAVAASPEVRLLQEQEGTLDNGFLVGYDLAFLKCGPRCTWADIVDMAFEEKIIRFRLCPTGEGCASGYGDYMTDLTTFAKSFLETYHKNDNWAEYGECRQFEANKYAENGFYVGGGIVDENVQYYIGPVCKWRTVGLALFTDAYCTVESTGLSFTDITGTDLLYGGTDLVYGSGGMTMFGQSYPCYGQNDNGESELNDFCVQNVENSFAKCETEMDGLLTYAEEQGISYSKNESGCSRIRQHGICIHRAPPKETFTVGKTLLCLGITAVVIGFAFFAFAQQRRKKGEASDSLIGK